VRLNFSGIRAIPDHFQGGWNVLADGVFVYRSLIEGSLEVRDSLGGDSLFPAGTPEEDRELDLFGM
jgi:hypothetical protein